MYYLSQYSPGNQAMPSYGSLEYIAQSAVSSQPYQASAVQGVPYLHAERGYSLSERAMPASERYAGQHSPYLISQHRNAYLLSSLQPEYHFNPTDFLKPGREGKFVGDAAEIREFVENAFESLLHAHFPDDIKISILPEEKFRKLAPHPSTIGLSINRRQQGLLSEVFVRNDSLARVMLTVGHELGHVLTETLENKQDEEAKAYAFSLAWMKMIKENNIANLGEAIVTERPAANGLHDIAFFFVEKLMRKGKEAWEVYKGVVGRMISIKIEGNYLF